MSSPMQDKSVKVLYIAGTGRSGSTLLSSILGEIDGFFSVGEINYMWDRSLKQDWLCECGVPLKECEVWGVVLNRAFGGTDRIETREDIHLHRGRKGTRMRHLPLMLMPGGERLLEHRLGNYLDSLDRLYRTIHSTTGCNVIVDSSKSPTYGRMLSRIPSLELYVLHLVRDPRATAHSFLRKKTEPSKKGSMYMLRSTPFESSVMWDAWNWAAERFGKHSPERYLRLRYEDFLDKPQKSLEQVLDLVRESPTRLPFLTDSEVELGVNHTISGNPNRFRTGVVELHRDEEWRTKMKSSDKLMVSLLTWPMLRSYGYRG